MASASGTDGECIAIRRWFAASRRRAVWTEVPSAEVGAGVYSEGEAAAVNRRMAWLAMTALALAGMLLFGWRQWKAWSTVELPDPVLADWVRRPEPSVFHADGGGRPATLLEMLRNMDAVVLARMNSAETDEVRLGGTHGLYYTGFRFVVLRAVTGGHREQEHITVWRLGMREDREEFHLRPELGQTFVLFLKRFRAAPGYYPSYGKYGTYEVRGGLLHQLAEHPTMAKYEGKSVEMFLDDLDAISKSM